MSRFANKVALVTGGGTGIGRAVAEALVAEGAKVVVTGRREEPLKQLAGKYPDAVRYVTTDVTEKGAPANAVRFAIEQFDRLDVLVNNAGMGNFGATGRARRRRPRTDPSGQCTRSVDHHARGDSASVQERRCCGQYLVDPCPASMPGASAYSGTKAAVERITSALAAELGPQGIRLNSVAPGVTETDMSAGIPQEILDGMIAQTPLGRLGRPEDIAKAVVFLASDDASWITGQVLQSSGGLML